MIIEDNNNSLVMSKQFDTVDFGIDNEDLQHIIGLLRNDIYSDKHLAIVRELSCNAMDANIAAGKINQSIRVTLPSKFSPHLKIRDFGTGLDFEDMSCIYSRYGKSTKRTSNNMVGAFGLGTKSPWALYSSFMVDSYQNGIKSSYSCVLDASNVGKLVVLGNCATTEPDGLEVTVPVANDDIDIFRNTAVKFFKYWSVMPEIEGFTPDDYNNIRGDSVAAVRGNGWQINENKSNYYRYNSNITAVMGNIAYPIVWDSVKGFNEALNEKYKNSSNNGTDILYHVKQFLNSNEIIFWFNIGEVKMSPSRETLQYNDLTNNSIIKKVNTLLDELAANAQDKINNCANLWEAKKEFGNLFEDYGSLHNLNGIISVSYNGKPLKNSKICSFESYNDMDLLRTFTKRKQNVNFHCYPMTSGRYNNRGDIECKKNAMILEVDQSKHVYIKKAVNLLAERHGVSTVYVLQFKDAVQRDNVFTDKELSYDFITKYSDISEDVKNTVVRNARTGGYTKRSVDSNEREVRVMSSKNLHHKFNDLPMIPFDMSVGGVYIETKGCDVYNADGWSVYRVEKFIKHLSAGLYNGDEIKVFFLNTKLVNSKVMKKGNWIKFTDYYDTEIKNIVDNHADLDLVHELEESEYAGFQSDYITVIKSTKNPVFKEFLELMDKRTKYHSLIQIVPESKLKGGKKQLADIMDAITAKYPLFHALNSVFRASYISDIKLAPIKEYLS